MILGVPSSGEQHVGRLQVAVDDAALVGVVHGAGQRLDQGGGVARRLRRAVELLLQAAAVEIFQREIRLAVVLADLVNLHDVGVLQPGDGLGLDLEAQQRLRSRRARR